MTTTADTVVGVYKEVEVIFRDVWEDNLEEEFAVIRRIVDKYPYVSMVCPNFSACGLLQWLCPRSNFLFTDGFWLRRIPNFRA